MLSTRKLKILKLEYLKGYALVHSFFLFIINDLPRAVKNSTIFMYAEDTSLYFKSKDLSLLSEAINEDLSHLDTWLISNKLKKRPK